MLDRLGAMPADKESQSPLSGRYQFPMSPQLERGLMLTFAHFVLGFSLAWAWGSLVQAVASSVSSLVQQPYCSRKRVFLKVIRRPCHYILSSSSSAMIPEAREGCVWCGWSIWGRTFWRLGRGVCDMDGPFRTEHAEGSGGVCVIWMVHLGQNMLKSLILCTRPVMGVNYRPLQKKFCKHHIHKIYTTYKVMAGTEKTQCYPLTSA